MYMLPGSLVESSTRLAEEGVLMGLPKIISKDGRLPGDRGEHLRVIRAMGSHGKSNSGRLASSVLKMLLYLSIATDD